MEEGNGKLFSVGGNDIYAKASMEWIDLTNGFDWTRQDLPFTIHRHCMTKFNKTHLIVTGGWLNKTVCEMNLKRKNVNPFCMKHETFLII